MSFGPCMCGDAECPSCGPLQGNGISMAEGVHQEWEGQACGTSQDLCDLCEAHGAEQSVPGTLDCEVWKFNDGSSIEVVWGGCAPIVRGASGDVVS